MSALARRALVAGALACCALCASGAVASAGAVQLQTIGTAFTRPISVVAAPGDPSRIYVVEQTGRVWELIDGVKQAQPFLDLGSMVAYDAGERGLESVVFAPDYATSHQLYAYYSASTPTADATGDGELDRFTTTSSDHVDLASAVRILSLPHHTHPSHYGGQLQFGPDGMLYLSTGDSGGSGDPNGNGQYLGDVDPALDQSPLSGKVLRIAPLPAGGYSVPAGNPFSGQAGPVWMLGLRNPWRWSFDRQTGDMIVADVGQDLYEEIDFIPAPAPGLTGGGGDNFGWNVREAKHAYVPTPPATGETAHDPCCVDPVIELNHSDGWLAIIGGYVIRDPDLPALAGTYIFGDNTRPELYGVTLNALSGASDIHGLGLAVSNLTGFGQDACGRIYVTLLNGTVQRLVADSGESSCGLGGGEAPGSPASDSSVPDGPGPPTTIVPAADRRAPRLSVSHARQRYIVALGRLLVGGRCDERCTITATGRLRIGRHVGALRSVKASVAAGRSATVKLVLSHALRAQARAALRVHHDPHVVMALRAVDQAGNATVTTSPSRSRVDAQTVVDPVRALGADAVVDLLGAAVVPGGLPAQPDRAPSVRARGTLR